MNTMSHIPAGFVGISIIIVHFHRMVRPRRFFRSISFSDVFRGFIFDHRIVILMAIPSGCQLIRRSFLISLNTWAYVAR